MSFGLIEKYNEKSDSSGSRTAPGKVSHEDQVPFLDDLAKDGQFSQSCLIFILFLHLHGF